jgi:predicted DCC family thiol-disulfide oxidoreductase YuxK
MSIKPEFPIRVFYDGSCSVCASEIEHYLHQDHGGRLLAHDISAPDFKPEQYHITLDEFMYELHVIDQSGFIFRGVEAFQAIWQAFPGSRLYGVLCAILSMPIMNPVARIIYKGFARIRPYLPKKTNCDKGSCKIGRKK